jgi:hypothetical protein
MKSFISKVLLILIIGFVYLSAQWGPDQRLTFDTGSSITSFDRCVAAIKDTIHVAWHDDRDGNYEIYYKRSIDNGENWGLDTRLSNDSASSVYPCIAIANSNIHIVWCDARDGNREIYYKRSTDNGENWGSDIRLTNDPDTAKHPSIAVSGENIHLAWYDNRDGNYEIYYKRSTDNGENWGVDARLTFDSNPSRVPSIAVFDSSIHIAWDDRRDGNYEIYYKRSTDNGENWGLDTRLTNNSNYSIIPSIAVSDSIIHIVWNDHNGNGVIYYKHSTNNGLNWEPEACISQLSSAYFPVVTASGSNVHAGWYNILDMSNTEIYYNCSVDAGENWGDEIRLTDCGWYSQKPSIAVSDTTVHVVWNDNRDGNYEIYYKHNPTGNSAVEEAFTDT